MIETLKAQLRAADLKNAALAGELHEARREIQLLRLLLEAANDVR